MEPRTSRPWATRVQNASIAAASLITAMVDRVKSFRGLGSAARLGRAPALAGGLLLGGLAGCDDGRDFISVDFKDRLTEAELEQLAPPRDENVFIFGFDPRSTPQEDARQYLPFLSYLSKTTGYRFELRFLPQDNENEDRSLAEKVQFLAMGAGSYIKAHREYGAIILARGRNRQGEATYGSVFVVAPGSPVKRLDELRGKRLAFGRPTSTQGHIIPRIVMAQNGISLSDLAAHQYTGSHAQCANAVLKGTVDACAMQDGMGLRLATEGRLRIIHVSDPQPSSGIVARPDVPPEVRDAATKALLEFDPAGRDAAGLYHWDRTEMPLGFVRASDADYADLRVWMNRLGLLEAARR